MASTLADNTISLLNLQNLFGCPIHNLRLETESAAYEAAFFKVNNLKVIYRKAKITPTKTGQFVTLWKRNSTGVIEPFDISDAFDCVVINVSNLGKDGFFVFPKSILIEKGVISTPTREGKRAIRVYPAWDKTSNKQAQKTQLWQLDYFLETLDKSKVFQLIDSNRRN